MDLLNDGFKILWLLLVVKLHWLPHTACHPLSPNQVHTTLDSVPPDSSTPVPTSTPVAVPTNTTGSSCRKPGVKYPIGIDFEGLLQALQEDAVLLIDVRNRWELEETGTWPKSVNLPLPELEEAMRLSDNEFMRLYKFRKPAPEDTNVVLTCRSGRRIQIAWKMLEPLGYCNIRLYFGSLLDWKANEGPLVPVPKAL